MLAIEELDPVLERALTYLCGKHHLPVQIHGKLDGMVQPAGENSVESVHKVLEGYLGLDAIPAVQLPEPPQMPVRPLSPPGILLRSQAGYEGAQGSIQR